MTYILSNKAKLDIKKITTRSRQEFGETQTLKYMSGFQEKLQFLAIHPDVGQAFPHTRTGNEYRHFSHESHVIYYRKRESDIFIIRILHHKMIPDYHL